MPKKTFDQRGQSVNNQQNAGRDIHNRTTRRDDSDFIALAHGGCIAQSVMIVGAIIAFTGFGIWMLVIFTGFVTPPGFGRPSDYGIPRLTLFPFGPIGFGAVIVGGVIFSIGKAIAYRRIPY